MYIVYAKGEECLSIKMYWSSIGQEEFSVLSYRMVADLIPNQITSLQQLLSICHTRLVLSHCSASSVR